MARVNPAFEETFSTLKTVMAKFESRLVVKTDKAGEYTLVTKTPSPFPQHKGEPMWFGMVKASKAYVSFHLMPLYMNDELTATVSPELKKRMQGKSCFNFKAPPTAEQVSELRRLTEGGLKSWREKKWV
jgi:protocatechuate 3,4-dioxygenase beta subunit